MVEVKGKEKKNRTTTGSLCTLLLTLSSRRDRGIAELKFDGISWIGEKLWFGVRPKRGLLFAKATVHYDLCNGMWSRLVSWLKKWGFAASVSFFYWGVLWGRYEFRIRISRIWRRALLRFSNRNTYVLRRAVLVRARGTVDKVDPILPIYARFIFSDPLDVVLNNVTQSAESYVTFNDSLIDCFPFLLYSMISNLQFPWKYLFLCLLLHEISFASGMYVLHSWLSMRSHANL